MTAPPRDPWCQIWRCDDIATTWAGGGGAVAYGLEVDLLERACGGAGIPEDNSAKTGVGRGVGWNHILEVTATFSLHSPRAGVRREWGGERRPLVLQL